MLKPWQLNVAALLFVMGIGALHEIMEYMSYLVLGESKGMLKPTTSYFFDTQRDLTNNLLGTLTALIIVGIVEWRIPEKCERPLTLCLAPAALLAARDRVIREHGVLGIPDLAFRHVTGDAIVLSFASRRQILLAGGNLVTFPATRPVEIRALCRFRLAMRVVA